MLGGAAALDEIADSDRPGITATLGPRVCDLILKCAGNTARDLVGEQRRLAALPLNLIGPNSQAALRLDQIEPHAQAILVGEYAPANRVGGSVRADRGQVGRMIAMQVRRLRRDDAHLRISGEIADQIVREHPCNRLVARIGVVSSKG